LFGRFQIALFNGTMADTFRRSRVFSTSAPPAWVLEYG
jgi:hypothetical protein